MGSQRCKIINKVTFAIESFRKRTTLINETEESYDL